MPPPPWYTKSRLQVRGDNNSREFRMCSKARWRTGLNCVCVQVYFFALLRPRFCRGLPPSRLCCLADKLLILQTLPNDHSENFEKPIRVRAFPSIKSKRLFIKIAEQVERLNADIRAADGPL